MNFSFDEMDREVSAFRSLARKFLDPTAEDCLAAFASNLKQIRSKASRSGVPETQYSWEIPAHNPLLTVPTRGYEKGSRQGGLEIFARLTSVWEITPAPKKRASDSSKYFRLSGKASVVVELINASDDSLVLSWNVDVATSPAAGGPGPPGCMLHVQIPNPENVPVPRLPVLAFTPLAVAEFAVGELFQGDWESHTLKAASEEWTSIQKKRLSRLLAWQLGLVQNTSHPPWTTLKQGRISATQLVGE